VAKCKDRIGELRKQGKTLILVTHDLDSVERWCDEAIWLHQGEVRDRGYPRRVIDSYRHFIEKGEESEILQEEQRARSEAAITEASGEASEVESARWGSREVEVSGVELLDHNGAEKRVFHPSDSLKVKISYQVNAPQADVVCGVAIHRADGLHIFGTNTDIDRARLSDLGDSGSFCCEFTRLGLLDGSYFVDVALHRADGYPFDYHKAAIHFSVRSDNKVVGVISPERRWSHNELEAGRCL
jgi:hypothetical protein